MLSRRYINIYLVVSIKSINIISVEKAFRDIIDHWISLYKINNNTNINHNINNNTHISSMNMLI
jgi:hypothetical protein